MPISNFFKSTIFKLVCVLHILFLFVFTSVAQDSSRATNKWNFLLEPYLMFPNLKGTTGVGTLPDAQVDADAGDIFSHLKMGAMLFFEMGNNKWAFSSDILYMNLDQEAEPGKMINSGNINLKQFAWELSGLRKLLPWLEAGIGGRFNSLKTEMNLETKNIGGGTTSRSKSLTQQWFDPIIIARVKSSL
ncbi:MAG: hypothetical protein ACXWCZ_06085, partial [Flavisolibacter sp.]